MMPPEQLAEAAALLALGAVWLVLLIADPPVAIVWLAASALYSMHKG